MFGSGRNIEQQACFPWVCLLSKVQSELAISQRRRRVLKELALRQSRDCRCRLPRFRRATAEELLERCACEGRR
jgi:hypothetical protein